MQSKLTTRVQPMLRCDVGMVDLFQIVQSASAALRVWAPGQNVTDFVVSATIEAVKPGACCGGCSCEVIQKD